MIDCSTKLSQARGQFYTAKKQRDKAQIIANKLAEERRKNNFAEMIKQALGPQ